MNVYNIYRIILLKKEKENKMKKNIRNIRYIIKFKLQKKSYLQPKGKKIQKLLKKNVIFSVQKKRKSFASNYFIFL